MNVRQGPCRGCGRRWLIGWLVNNLLGVCSGQCRRAALNADGEATE